MPLLNDFKIDGDSARAALQPGESLLALSQVAVAYGVTEGPPGAEPDVDAVGERVEQATDKATGAIDRFEGKSRPRRWLMRTLLAPFSADVSLSPRNFPESWLGGRTCSGPGGSAARDVQRAVRTSDDTYFAVTDRGVLVLERKKTKEPMTALWTARRSVVAGARRRPRMFARARFELRFTDGSWIVLSGWPPHIGSWHAKQVVSALGY